MDGVDVEHGRLLQCTVQYCTMSMLCTVCKRRQNEFSGLKVMKSEGLCISRSGIVLSRLRRRESQGSKRNEEPFRQGQKVSDLGSSHCDPPEGFRPSAEPSSNRRPASP